MVNGARRRMRGDSGMRDGLVQQLGALARGLPGANFAERQLKRVEDVLVSEVRKRLDLPTGRGPAVELRYAEPLRVMMAELLDRSVTLTRADSDEYLFATILRALVPDEARMIATLADGSAHAVVDVALRGGPVVLANASSLGRTAGVQLPANVPIYLNRLIGFGLAELGPADSALSLHYEMLLTDETVRAAEARISGRLRHLRRSVRISELGRRFWAACEPDGAGPQLIGP